jgi:hypothetical protein
MVTQTKPKQKEKKKNQKTTDLLYWFPVYKFFTAIIRLSNS